MAKENKTDKPVAGAVVVNEAPANGAVVAKETSEALKLETREKNRQAKIAAIEKNARIAAEATVNALISAGIITEAQRKDAVERAFQVEMEARKAETPVRTVGASHYPLAARSAEATLITESGKYRTEDGKVAVITISGLFSPRSDRGGQLIDAFPHTATVQVDGKEIASYQFSRESRLISNKDPNDRSEKWTGEWSMKVGDTNLECTWVWTKGAMRTLLQKLALHLGYKGGTESPAAWASAPTGLSEADRAKWNDKNARATEQAWDSVS